MTAPFRPLAATRTATRLPAGAIERAFDPDHEFPAVVELIREVNAHDDVEWFPTTASLELDWAAAETFDPRRDARLIEEGGRLVGAANLDWRERAGKVVHGIEIWVRPEDRRRGIGRYLLAWAEARARESIGDGSGGNSDLPHELGCGVAQHFAGGTSFALSAGYRPVRYSFLMRRPLDEPIPDAPLPPGLEIRPVLPEHHRRIWDADTEAFQDHWEPANRHEADYIGFFGHPDIDTSLWQIAWAGDQVAGSVINGIYRDENEAIGLELAWLDHVSVRRPWRRQGLATALIVRSLRILRDRGMAIGVLGVDADNPTGALGLYERLGFRRHKTWVSYRKPV